MGDPQGLSKPGQLSLKGKLIALVIAAVVVSALAGGVPLLGKGVQTVQSLLITIGAIVLVIAVFVRLLGPSRRR